jgi:hypothetical protein
MLWKTGLASGGIVDWRGLQRGACEMSTPRRRMPAALPRNARRKAIQINDLVKNQV